MSRCNYCSAPLNRDRQLCQYCNRRVEIDLHGYLDTRLYAPESDRMCPHCDIPLSTIDLKIEKRFLIEKCNQCHGLFFDPGELEMLMEKSVSNVFYADAAQLTTLQNQAFSRNEVKYIPCPACNTLMNRKIFGYRSGVMVDHCRAHGYWLDEGELRQLQKWKKAGGEITQNKRHAAPETPRQNQPPPLHKARHENSFSPSIVDIIVDAIF